MAEYHACVIEPEGRILGVIQLVRPDDDTDKEEAKQLVDRDDLRLWQNKPYLAHSSRTGDMARSQETGKNDRSRVHAELSNEVAKSSSKSNRRWFGRPRIAARSMRK